MGRLGSCLCLCLGPGLGLGLGLCLSLGLCLGLRLGLGMCLGWPGLALTGLAHWLAVLCCAGHGLAS